MMGKVGYMTAVEDFQPSQLDRIEAAQLRLEAKMDALLDALADEQAGEEESRFDLDGNPLAGERDQTEAL